VLEHRRHGRLPEVRLAAGLARRLAAAVAVRRRGPQGARIGVDAEHYLRAPLGHAGGEEISERELRAQRPFTALFSPLPAVKRGTREAAI
jgi:hypothetical protein